MSIESRVEVPPHNSTTGRSLTMPGLVWLRRGMRVTSWVAPSAAAALADRLFFRPVGARVRTEEAQVLERGRELQVKVGRARVTGWSWGTGRTVLLAHGWAGHAGQMTGLVSPLVEAGFRAVALDMPGHGRSEGTSSSVVHFADAVTAVGESFGPLHGVVAHSLGAGGVTLAMARGLPVERAVFFAPPGDFEVFWQRFRQGLGLTPAIWERLQRRAEARLGVSFAEVMPLHHAPQLSTPLRVFHDTNDREVPLESGVALVAAWPGASLVQTRGLGHVRILKDPALAAQAAAFLRGEEAEVSLPAAGIAG